MKKYYVFLFLLISSLSVYSQLSNEHYFPPLKQGGNNQAIRQQAFYLSTPETTAFDVNVFQGINATAIATLTISNISPGKYDVADGDNNITLVTNTNTGIELDNSGLRFISENGEDFYVNYRGRSGAQATSLTSKGKQAIGTLFKWGGRPNYGNGQNSLNATLGIMAVEDGITTINIFDYGTDCEFRLQGDNDGITSDNIPITLTKGQTYVLEAWRNATVANVDCWLGATIQSDKKIAISNGNLNGAPRVGSNSRDAAIDQPVPENVLGREYVFIRGNGANDIETPIIIGTQNGTDIFVGGVLQTTINTGEYYVINGTNYTPASVGGNMYVTTSKEVYAYQHLSGSSGIQTGGLNFIAPVNCLLPDKMDNISDIRDVDGLNFNGGITIVASTSTLNANIVVTDGSGVIPLANEQMVNGTGDWKTFYIPNLTGDVSVQSTGPIAVGFLGVNSNAGIAGYFSGFDTVPVVELDVSGGGCLPGADVFEITGNFDAYLWFENGTEIPTATTNTYTPSEPGDFFVRVTKGTCTYDSGILSVYNCDPEIVITKTVDNSTVIEGDTVTFTVTVEHLGVNPVSNLVINDVLPAELTFGMVTPSFGTWTEPDWTIGDMFSGEVHTLTIEATVNEVPADITVTNVISNTQTEVEANALTDDPDEDVTIINNELEITKTDLQPPPDGSYNKVGEIITYNFEVTNTGSQVIPSVTITDPKIDIGSLSPASVTNLAISATANFTATHTITQADIDADQVVNTATAEGTLSNGFVISDISDDPDDPTTTLDDPTITPIDQEGQLILEKIALPAADGLYDTLGELITYQFRVINTGNVTLTNVTIVDTNIDGGSLSPASVASLAPGDDVLFTATHEIVAADFTAGNVMNIAEAQGTEIVEGLVVTDQSDDPTTPAMNDATIVGIQQFGELTLTKADDGGTYNAVGQTITYTLVVTNTGNVPLSNVNIVDPIADVIRLISTTGDNPDGNLIVDNLDPDLVSFMGESATYEVDHIITQEDLDNGSVVNSAIVGGQFLDSDMVLESITDVSDDPNDPTTNIDDPTVVPLGSNPSISVTKIADDDSNVSESQTVTYTYIVTNTGNVTFDEVSLADMHSGNGSLETIILQSTTGTDDGLDNDVDQLDPLTNAIWTATYEITALDITDQNDITNTVTATATPRTGSLADPDDLMATEIVTVNPIETVCGGTTLSHDLTADVDPSIISFSWSASDNPLVLGETTSNVIDTEITDTLLNGTTTDQEVVYTIEGSDIGGIVQEIYTYIVTVQPSPTVLNTTRTVEICTGDTINQNLISHVDNFNDDVTFSWLAVENTDVDGETITVSNDDRIQDTLINTSTSAQDVVYTVTPTADINGCIGTIYTITVTVAPAIVLPPNDTETVDCLTDAAQPVPPVINDINGDIIVPVITENADPACEGDKIYTYTYTDCAGNVSVYTYTFTIDTPAFIITDADGASTVDCIADATETFTLPTVTDECGNTLTASTVVITENPDPLTCEGTRTYTYTYIDCAGNIDTWSYVYTIDTPAFTISTLDGSATVNDIIDAVQPTAPLVTDVCGNNITPVITENMDPLCDGLKIYTFTYTDCAANLDIYTFTYTIDVTDTLEISDAIITICSDVSLGYDLTALTSLPNVTFEWVVTPNSNVSGALDGNGTIIPDTIENISGSSQDVLYTITPFNTNSCIGNTFTLLVTVSPEPFNALAPTAITCSNVALNHDLSSDVNLTGTSFSWVASDNPNISGETTTPNNSTSINDTLINISGAVQTVVYTITPTSVDGCLGNPYSYTVTVSPEAELVLTKSFLPATDGLYDTVGEVIEYEITIENINDVEVSNVSVTDMNADAGSIIPATIPTIPALSSVIIIASHTITQNDLDAGQVVNSANAVGVDPCGNIVSDVSDDPSTGTPNDNTITPLNQTPSLSLEKTGTFNDENGDGFPQQGETITYNFEVVNTGNVTLIDITISDPLIVVNGGPISLLPGISDTVTFSGTYGITQGDIDSGSITNTAKVTSEAPDGSTITDVSDDPNDPDNNDTNGDGEPDDATVITLSPNPELTISKTGVFIDSNNDGLAQVGETIQYSFDIANTGNMTIFGITLNDPLVPVTGGPINLLPGQVDSTTFTATYIVTQDDVNTGSVTNSATASGMDPSGNNIEDVSDDPTTTADNDNTVTSLLRDPMLTLLKTANFNDENGDGIPQQGETITYLFDIRNTGNVTILNISISDPIATVTGGPIDLDPNQSDATTFTATYTIMLTDLNTGSITNSATVTGEDPDGNIITDISDDPNNPDNIDVDGDGDPDDGTITILTSDPQISISKIGVFEDESGDGLVQVGETISYTFDISNMGNVTVTNINITDALVSVTGGPINLDPLQNDTTSFTASYSVTQNDIDAGVVQNTAVANGQDPNGDIVTDTSDDPNNSDNNDTNGDGEPDDVTNTILPLNGSISLIKTEVTAPDGSYDSVGEQIFYELTITNTGNVTLTNIMVSDANADVGSIIPAMIASLTPGEIAVVNAAHTITQDEIDAGVVNNSASVTSIDPFGNQVNDISDDPDNTTNNDTDGDGDPDDITETNIIQNPSIALEKLAIFNDENGDGVPQQGETITYNFNVSNTGNVTLNDITITDPLVVVNGGPIALAPGTNDVSTFYATYTISQSDIDEGSITNSAIISAEDTNENIVTDTSDDPNDTTNNDTNGDGDPDDVTVTTLTSNPELTILKTGVFIDANNDGLAQAGETIQYNFDVVNTGNVTISDISVSDPLIAVTGGPITLIPGETDNTTFTAVYVLLQSDVNNGEVINTATVSGMDPSGMTITDDSDDPTTVENNDPTNTTLSRDPQLTLFKIANFNDENNDGIPQAGETISYVFDLRNTGNVTITNITISDPIVSVVGGPIALDPAEKDDTSFTATYSITQSDIDAGSISNSALVTGEDSDGGVITDVSDYSDDPDNSENEDIDGDGDPDDPTVTELIGDPGLTLLKTGTFNDINGDGFAQIGETIIYSFEVINSGNLTLTDIFIADPLVTVNGGPVDLIPDQIDTTTFTATYTLTQFDIDSGSISNAAVVSGQDPNGTIITDNSDDPNDSTDIDDNNDGNPDDDTVIVLTVKGAISIIKESFDAADGNYDMVGEQINYLLTITNTGSTTLTNVSITDNNADSGSINPSNITILLPGESVSATAIHTVTQSDLDNGNVANTAIVEANDPFGNVLTDISDDPNDSTDVDSNGDGDPDDVTNTDMIQNPSIELTKASDIAPDGLWDTVGEVITYTLQLTNTGNVTLSNVNIVDANADVGSILPSTIATLLPGEIVTIIAAHTITQQDLDTGSVTNTASVTANDTSGGIVTDDSDDPNNSDDVDANGDGDPDDATVTSTPQFATISITKTVDTMIYHEVGDVLTYSINITNTGNVSLLNLIVLDPNAVLTSSNTISSLAPGDSFMLTAEHTITADDITNGFVSNSAFVNALVPNSTMTISEDSDDPTDVVDVDIDNDGDPDDPTISYWDADGDGIPNIIDLDDDNDGITDLEEQNGDPLLDTDGDGIIDSLDLDADGDGIYDYIEAGHDGIDSDGDGAIDGPFGDDGIPDSVQNDPDNGEVNYDPQDTDGDGVDDFQDIDDDNDGILTIDENPDPDGNMIPDDAFDIDGDGIPDYLEPNNSDPDAEDGIEVFNGITPNGDGDNDVLVITGLEKLKNTVEIYNRWGVIVFETQNYGRDNNFFTGISTGRVNIKENNQLPVGTYYYIIKYTLESGKEKSMTGYLYINR